MDDQMQIKGGASQFEAAVIAVVLDQIAAEEKSARQGKTGRDNKLPSWVTAIRSTDVPMPKPSRYSG